MLGAWRRFALGRSLCMYGGLGSAAVTAEVSGQGRLSPQIQSICVCPYQI